MGNVQRFGLLALVLALFAAVAAYIVAPASVDLEQPWPDQRNVLTMPVGSATVEGMAFPDYYPVRFPLKAKHAFPGIRFKHSVLLLEGPDNRFYAVEKGGLIKSWIPGTDQVDTVLDIQDKVWSKGGSGLLGLALDPGFEENGTLYVHYTTDEPRTIVVSAFKSTGSPPVVDPASEQVLIKIDKTHFSHNGGMLTFGPDGMLYVAIGDGMESPCVHFEAQKLSSLLGSIIRIDVSAVPDGGPYTIPPDNPFVGRGSGVKEEIWAYGLRQPWRFSIDTDGALWVADVGNKQIEEINRVTAGANLGWCVFEGTQKRMDHPLQLSDTLPPLLEMQHPDARAVIGGYVYRGEKLPHVKGAYIYGDYISGKIWALRHEGGEVVSNEEVTHVRGLAAFTQTRAGELYGVSLQGRVYEFEDMTGTDVVFPSRLSQTGLFDDLVTLQPANGVIPYDVASPLWSDGAEKRRWIALPPGEKIGFRENGHWAFPVGTVAIKHFGMQLSPGAPVHRLETRVLVLETAGWAGYTYKWNEEQTDAELLGPGMSEQLEIERDGETVSVRYDYPSRSDCMQCHNPGAGFVLGLHTDQMNLDVTYTDGVKNQIQALSDLGVFDAVPPAPGLLPARTDPADLSASIEERARAYLATNCSSCHHGRGPAGRMDLRITTPIENARALDTRAERFEPGQGLPRTLIVPGDHANSLAWWRMNSSKRRHHMPPIATNQNDPNGLHLIATWIDRGAMDPGGS